MEMEGTCNHFVLKYISYSNTQLLNWKMSFNSQVSMSKDCVLTTLYGDARYLQSYNCTQEHETFLLVSCAAILRLVAEGYPQSPLGEGPSTTSPRMATQETTFLLVILIIDARNCFTNCCSPLSWY